MEQIHRFLKHILIIFIIISAALGLMRFNSLQLGSSYDDAHYIILAESLASGQGYQLINFPRPQMERAFPPGWPLLLTPFTFLFPGNYTILKLFSLLLWLASILLIYRLFSRQIESPHLEIVTGLVAVNPLLVGTSVTVMSESAYLFFSLLALTVFDSWNSRAGGKNDWLIILIAVIALYTQLIRTIGISLSIALVVTLLLTRRFREAGLTMGVFIAGAFLQTWITLSNGRALISASYQSQVFNSLGIDKIAQMWSNALGYFNEVLAGSLIPIFGSKVTSLLNNYGLQLLPSILNAAIIFLIIFGMAVSRNKIRAMDIYFIIYIFGILAFWNPRVGSVKARFLIPIIPFLYFYLMQGIIWVIVRLTRNKIMLSARIAAGVSGIIALSLLVRNFQDWHNPIKEQMTDLSIGTSWIAENAPPDAIVMVNEPVPAYVHTQRKTIGYPNAGQDLGKYLNNQGIDYIVISPKLQSPRSTKLDGFTEEQILPILNSAHGQFVVVHVNPEYNVTVYKVERDANQ